MPITPPALDDHDFDSLVEELLGRIPAHVPEYRYRSQNLGDPGRTLIELFAWLGDTLLYRINLIPERQRLQFLRLLGARMRAARPAQGIVGVLPPEDASTEVTALRSGARVVGPVAFETLDEVQVLPVRGSVFCKRRLTAEEQASVEDVLSGLEKLYQLNADAEPYRTTPLFEDGIGDPGGFDVVANTVDGALWIALTSEHPAESLGAITEKERLLSVGVVPAIDVPDGFDDVSPAARVPLVWEIVTVEGEGDEQSVDFLPLEIHERDETEGTTRAGVVTLELPTGTQWNVGVPSNDVVEFTKAGVATFPPRIDDEELARRLVAWLRVRPKERPVRLAISWAGVNAVAVDQLVTVASRVVGQSDGSPEQRFQLPGRSVEAESFELHVEEEDGRYLKWRRIDDLTLAGPTDRSVYALDEEAGVIAFGDGARGRIPGRRRRVKVERMRFGGGEAGNLPPGSLTSVEGRSPAGRRVTFECLQGVATVGGSEAETLDEAERRIPAIFRHRDRAVTRGDFERLALETPGADVGKVHVLERFEPHHRRSEVPGIVSVIVVPRKERVLAPNPRPDRPFLIAVKNYLDERRPLGTELYVIGCEYVAVGISAGVTLRDGVERNTVLHAIRTALREYLWPLPGYGPGGEGWPLARAVRDREIEVVIARVEGVDSVSGVNLFERLRSEGPKGQVRERWSRIDRLQPCDPIEIPMARWQLPELRAVIIEEGDPPDDPARVPEPPGPSGIPVPVVPEVC